MTATLLDFSRRPELALYAEIVKAVDNAAASLGITTLIVGAVARDLLLHYASDVELQRQTEDFDLAMGVPDWRAFTQLREKLIATGGFAASPGVAHELRFRNGLPVDFIPFGKVETRERRIEWPPKGEVIMDVFGIREALASAHDVTLPGDVLTKVVSLAGLALLKVVCWHDRHYRSPRKDAQDLQLILRSYLRAGNEDRLWGDYVSWTQENGFDYEHAGARMLGHDIRMLLDDDGVDRVGKLLLEQVDPDVPALLPNEMDPADPDRARDLLYAMLGGLMDNWHK